MIRQGTHAKRNLIGAARDLRLERTQAEYAMWNMVRGRQLRGLKFRRQHQIGDSIVDFYCIELRLILELDGAYHFDPGVQEMDAARTATLQRYGMTVLRFENEEVANPKFVLKRIERAIDALIELVKSEPPCHAPHP